MIERIRDNFLYISGLRNKMSRYVMSGRRERKNKFKNLEQNKKIFGFCRKSERSNCVKPTNTFLTLFLNLFYMHMSLINLNNNSREKRNCLQLPRYLQLDTRGHFRL